MQIRSHDHSKISKNMNRTQSQLVREGLYDKISLWIVKLLNEIKYISSPREWFCDRSLVT